MILRRTREVMKTSSIAVNNPLIVIQTTLIQV
jgi:hypothetical protein